jgi:hypothetical protein
MTCSKIYRTYVFLQNLGYIMVAYPGHIDRFYSGSARTLAPLRKSLPLKRRKANDKAFSRSPSSITWAAMARITVHLEGKLFAQNSHNPMCQNNMLHASSEVNQFQAKI